MMEQKQTKRRVGRPAGSGMIDDDPPLVRVAEILLDQPEMKPTTAMWQVLRTLPSTTKERDRTILRRWQSRWKIGSTRYTEKARAKRRPTVTVHRSRFGVVGTFAEHRLAETLAKANLFASALDPAKLSAFQQAARGYIDSPVYQAAQGFMNSPAYRAMQEPEFMRRMREQQDMIERMFPRGIGS